MSDTISAPAALDTDAPLEPAPRRSELSPVRWFVAIALVMGTVFVFMTPALTGYDEPYHYVRAWQLANLQVHSEKYVHADGARDLGAHFPATLATTMSDILRDGFYHKISPNCHGESAACAFKHLTDTAPHGKPVFIGFGPSAVYAPVPYIPSALAMRAAWGLGLSTLATLWLARLFDLVAYVLLVAFALARMPRWRVVLAVIALAPVCVFQAAMVSADGITIALALVAVALATRLAMADPGLTPARALVEVGLVGVALGLAKPPYILFLLLFVPAIVRHRHTIVGKLTPVALLPGIALFVWWSQYAQSVWIAPTNPYAAPGAHLGYAYTNVDESKQLKFVEHNPWHFFGAVGLTIGRTWRSLLHDAVAQVPGWTEPQVVGFVVTVLTYAALFVAVWRAARRERPDGTRGQRRLEIAIDALVALGTFVAVFLLAYTGWNAVRAPRIDAFQGRYLLPVLAVLAILIAPRFRVRAAVAGDAESSAGTARFWTWAAWACVTGALVVTALGLTLHYY